jgi:hypothetical protein
MLNDFFMTMDYVKIIIDFLSACLIFSIQTPIRVLSPQARVVELTDQDIKRWNEPLVKSIFLKEEADLIKNIPLSPFGPKDCMT